MGGQNVGGHKVKAPFSGGSDQDLSRPVDHLKALLHHQSLYALRGMAEQAILKKGHAPVNIHGRQYV
jgi:hypothetical protein